MPAFRFARVSFRQTRAASLPAFVAAIASVTALTALGASPAAAQFTTYSSQAAFQAALNPGFYTENFNAVTAGSTPSPRTFTGGSFSYSASTPTGSLYIVTDPNATTNRALSNTTALASITINFSGSATAPTAFGGQFFNTADIESAMPGSVLVSYSAADGSSGSQTITHSTLADYTSANFFGISSNSGSALTQVTISTNTASSYVTIDNTVTGARVTGAAAPEPGSLYLLGMGLAGGAGMIGTVKRRSAKRAA